MHLLDVSAVGIFMEGLSKRLEEDGRLVDNTNLGDKFLHGKCSDGNHGEASILQFLQLHVHLCLALLGVQAEWVKSQVASKVFRRVAASSGNTVKVNGTSYDKDANPVCWGNLTETTVQERWCAVTGINECRKSEQCSSLLVP